MRGVCTAFRVKAVTNCAAGENVFRFYSSALKTHLYTMDEYEKSVLIGYNNLGIWKYEGITSYVIDPSTVQ